MATNKGSSERRKAGKNQFVTKSGAVIKVHRSLSDRLWAKKDLKSRRKADRLHELPKNRFKRIVAHFEPKRLYHYWFSREGAVMALKVVGIGAVAGFLLMFGLFAYFRKDLPNLKDISGNNIGGSVRYYDRTGKTLLWEDYDAVKRIPVTDSNISPFMKDATVAVEDKDFFKHGGFDVRGIARAGVNDVLHKGSTQGGSTITQQLVKLTQDWSKDRTITRKIKELILAVELERSYSKQDILTGYLNTAPYGGIEYGVEAASRDYFQKSAKDLTLPEAAMLAAIPKSPRYYSPYNTADFDKSAFDARKNYILDLMEQQGKISKQQRDDAKKVDVLAEVKPRESKYAGIKAPWFVLAAKNELEQKYGADTVNRNGWRVTTTLDTTLQDTAEQLVAKNLSNTKRFGADEEAMVGEDVQTGQIVSLVGGTDFTNPNYGQNNFAAGILLPPGSSFKPYDYTTFIDNNNNVGAGSVLYDSEGPLPGYPCTNKALPKNGGNCLKDYDFLTPGPLTLRYALGGSRNIPAVKAMLSAVPNDNSNGKVTSINKVISTATAMMANPYANGNTYNCYGDEALTQTTQCFGASAIGDGAYLHLDDHVNGLSTLGRMGNAIPRTYILAITKSDNKNLYKWSAPKGSQVIKQDTAYIVNNMASDPNASYLPGSCSATSCTPLSGGGYKFHRYNGWNFAIKTGTTNDGYDGLMTSWSPKYAVVSWVGNHTRHVTLSTSMEVLTEPLTRGWMEAAHANLKPDNWTQPAGVKSLPAFIVRNHVHFGDVEPSPTNDLFPSWYQAKTASNTSQVTDKVSGKLATSCTPALAKDTATNSDANKWNVDIFVGGSSNSGADTPASGNDDVHLCGDALPSVTLTVSDSVDGSANSCTDSCTLTATVSAGTHPLSGSNFGGQVNFIVDGQTVYTAGITDPSVDTLTYNYGVTGTGSHTISAQVIDSVLYDSTSSPATVNFTTASGAANSSGTLNLSHTGDTAAAISFSWNKYAGASKFQLCASKSNGDGLSCTTINDGNATSGSVIATGGSPNTYHKAYVRALNSSGGELARSDLTY